MEDREATPPRPLLFLSIRVAPERKDELLGFLRQAVTTYEELPGVRVRLLRSRQDPRRWIEMVEYPDQATYEADQRRVEDDPRMRQLLDRWHTLLEAEVGVETWEEWTHHFKEPSDE